MTLSTPAELTCIPIITKYQSSLITFYAELKHKILVNLRSLLIYTTWYPDGFDKKKEDWYTQYKSVRDNKSHNFTFLMYLFF